MVRFEEDKLVIEIIHPYPVEKWMDIHMGIYDIVRFVKQETLIDKSFFSVIDLLGELMPDYDDAKKMIELNSKTTNL